MSDERIPPPIPPKPRVTLPPHLTSPAAAPREPEIVDIEVTPVPHGESAPPPRDHTAPPRRGDSAATGPIAAFPFMTFVSAALFLYVGFGLGLRGVSGNAVYDGSVAVFTWGAKVIGVALLVCGALEWMRLRIAVLLDLLTAGAATAMCLGVGAVWLLNSDMEGVLLLLFAALNGSATRAAYERWSATRPPRHG